MVKILPFPRHLALGTIVLVGTALHAQHMTQRALWFDEAFCWRLTQFPWAEMVARVGRDNHPPAYFAMLKLWTMVFGTSLGAMRGLGLLATAVTAIGAYGICVEIRKPGADNKGANVADLLNGRPGVQPTLKGSISGLLAALIVMLSPPLFHWGAQVRMYAPSCALATTSSWALLRALAPSAHPRRRWVLYGVLAVVFALVHYFAIFSLSVQALLVLGALLTDAGWSPKQLVRDTRLRHALAVAGVVAVAWFPWIPIFLWQRTQVMKSWWMSPLTPKNVLEMWTGLAFPPPTWRLSHSAVGAFLFGSVLVTLAWRGRRGERYLVAAAVMPFLLGLVLSLQGSRILYPRYLMVAHAFSLTALSVASVNAYGRPLRALMAIFLIFIYGRQVPVDLRDLDASREPDAQAAVQYLEQHRKPGEPVILVASQYFTLRYHARDTGGWHIYGDRDGQVSHWLGDALVTEADDIVGTRDIDKLSTSRIWVVDSTCYGKALFIGPPGWDLANEARFASHEPVGDLLVQEWKRVKDEDREPLTPQALGCSVQTGSRPESSLIYSSSLSSEDHPWMKTRQQGIHVLLD